MILKNLLVFFAAMFHMCAAVAETVALKTARAQCLVDLDGARVVSFSVGGKELLWNDKPPQKAAADWAHGGIPVCWPFFGVDADGKIHGVAWRRRFTALSRSECPERSRLVMELREGDARLEYSVVLTDKLMLEMTTENSGTNLFRCSYGYHPYFLVGERDRCTINGADGFPFEDDPSVVNGERGLQRGAVELAQNIDRIFSLPEAACGTFVLNDAVCKRTISVICEGATHLNVWNPGAAKNCPGKVPGDEWRRFVCVEPIVLALKVPPRGRKTLKMTVEVNEVEK
jgi:glucose-6-phosphate 1-epimerase